MIRPIYKVYLCRKSLEVFRRKGAVPAREAYLINLKTRITAHQFSRNYLTSPLVTEKSPHPNSDYLTHPAFHNPLSLPTSTETISPPPPTMPILPNHRLLARAFHRVHPTTTTKRSLSSTALKASKTDNKSNSSNWTGGKPEDHVTRQDDTNVHKDASEGGMKERAEGNDTAGAAVTEKEPRNSNKRAKEEFPEAPDPAIGMQDERGGVSIFMLGSEHAQKLPPEKEVEPRSSIFFLTHGFGLY